MVKCCLVSLGFLGGFSWEWKRQQVAHIVVGTVPQYGTRGHLPQQSPATIGQGYYIRFFPSALQGSCKYPTKPTRLFPKPARAVADSRLRGSWRGGIWGCQCQIPVENPTYPGKSQCMGHQTCTYSTSKTVHPNSWADSGFRTSMCLSLKVQWIPRPRRYLLRYSRVSKVQSQAEWC